MRSVEDSKTRFPIPGPVTRALLAGSARRASARRVFVVRRRSSRVALLILLLILALPLTLAPIRTVKGLAEDTGNPTDGYVSIDARRVAYQITPYGVSYVYLFDTASDTYTSFAAPTLVSNDPIVQGDKIVLSSSVDGKNWGIYYCVIPHVSPLPASGCGRWKLIGTAAGVDPASTGLSFRGDIVVWARVGGFSYYRFSANKVTNVTTPFPAPVVGSNVSISLATDGSMIAFSAKASSSSSSYTVMYYDTTSSTPAVVDTHLPTGLGFLSVAQGTIVFGDNSTRSGNRIRYSDTLRNQTSPAGTGPLGFLASTQAISFNRIAFAVSESDLGFDCNGSGIISSTEFCLRYWNIRSPSYVAPLLAPSAAPVVMIPTNLNLPSVAIDGQTIAFSGNSQIPSKPVTAQYVTVPMQGDVNQDGVVNFLDLGVIGSCFLQTIRGKVC